MNARSDAVSDVEGTARPVAEARRGVVRVRLGEQVFAFPIGNVSEVVRMETVTPLYHLPGHMVGIMNLRGQIRPVVDLGHVIGMAGSSGKSAVLVRLDASKEAAFLVDEVLNVDWTAAETLTESPSTIEESRRGFFQGMLSGSPPTLLLSVERLFAPDLWNFK